MMSSAAFDSESNIVEALLLLDLSRGTNRLGFVMQTRVAPGFCQSATNLHVVKEKKGRLHSPILRNFSTYIISN